MTTPYESCSEFSELKIDELRSKLKELPLDHQVVVLCGSFARREASKQSDIDFSIISDQEDNGSMTIDAVRTAINNIIPIGPASDGVFGNEVQRDEILSNIGGQDDSNANITHRVLILLEGEWLFNRTGLREFRRAILERYIQEGMTDHQLALFLLNDIIRYYRTVAVDYEFKTSEGGDSKPWAIRNIKLVFSRKLLYASDLFSIGMTADRARDEKIQILEELFELPVIERMERICGKAGIEGVLASYNCFLKEMADPDVRKKLIKLGRTERQDPVFRRVKNEGHNFTRELLKLFENTFDSTHPIRRAVMF